MLCKASSASVQLVLVAAVLHGKVIRQTNFLAGFKSQREDPLVVLVGLRSVALLPFSQASPYIYGPGHELCQTRPGGVATGSCQN